MSFVSVISFIVYRMFFLPSDEIGYLGANKIGRQVFIQTMDSRLKPQGEVTSEFFDTPLIGRLFIGDHLTRTTIRFNFYDRAADTMTMKTVMKYLGSPYARITLSLSDSILLQENYIVGFNEFDDLLKNKKVITIEDLLAGLGFKTYEVYFKGNPKFSIELRNVKNTIHLDF